MKLNPCLPIVLVVLVLLAALPVSVDARRARRKRENFRPLGAAVDAHDTTGFLAAARTALGGGSRNAVKGVAEGFARLADGGKLDAQAYLLFHNAAARVLSKVEGRAGIAAMKSLRKSSKYWRARVVLLDAAALHPELDIREGATDSLADRDPRVVRRSLYYLRNLDMLEKRQAKLSTLDLVLERFLEIDAGKSFRGEEWDRTRLAFRSALTAILKVSLPAAVDYENYLSTRRDVPDLFDPVGRHAGGLTKLTLFGTEVTGKNIAFVVDVSGSMMATDRIIISSEKKRRGTTVVAGSDDQKKLIRKRIESRRRINRAKKELQKVIRTLADDVKFNIIAYSSDVAPWKTKLVPCRDATRKAALKYVSQIRAQGVTVTDMALEEAFADLSVDTIYLITDGAPTHVGSRGPEKPTDADDLMRSIHRRVGALNFLRDVRVFTIGFPDAEEDFLKKLSRDNNGTYAPIR